MKRLAFLFASLIPVFTFSQITFEKTFGGELDDGCYSVRQTIDSGYILVGSKHTDQYEASIYLIKANEHGEALWEKLFEYDNANIIVGHDVQQTIDSGFIITGRIDFDTISSDAFLLKVDKNGNSKWFNVYDHVGGDTLQGIGHGYEVKETSDSGYIMVGSAYDATYNNQVYLLKIDKNGFKEWENICSGSFGEFSTGNSIEQASDNGFIIGGQLYYGFHNSPHALLMRTNEVGDTIWTKIVSDDISEIASIEKVDENNFLIGINENHLGGNVTNKILIIDINGNILWSKTYDLGDVLFSDLIKTNTGDYIAGGDVSHDTYDKNMYLLKINSEGDTVWSNEFGVDNRACCRAMIQANDGGYALAGFTERYLHSDFDVYLVKTNRDGMVTWSREYTIEKGINTFLYPNPFTTSTTLSYFLKQPSFVHLSVFNQLGQLVYRHSEEQTQGSQQLEWDAQDQPEGLYYYQLKVGDQVSNGKMVKAQ